MWAAPRTGSADPPWGLCSAAHPSISSYLFYFLTHRSLWALKLTCELALRIGISPTLAARVPSSINDLSSKKQASCLFIFPFTPSQSLEASSFLRIVEFFLLKVGCMLGFPTENQAKDYSLDTFPFPATVPGIKDTDRSLCPHGA